jgi:hypothetical protein
MIPLSPDTTLRCRTCGGVKHWSEFVVKQRQTNQLDSQCKLCKATYQRQYTLSPHGNAVKLWLSMTYRAENRDGKHSGYKDIKIEMTRDAFMAWCVPEINKFYSQYPNERPSLDRIDNRGNYCFGNIRIIPWSEHRKLKKLVRWQRYVNYLKSNPTKMQAFLARRNGQLSSENEVAGLIASVKDLIGAELTAEQDYALNHAAKFPELLSLLSYVITHMR